MVLPYDNFNRAFGPLGDSTTGHEWTLRPTGPYGSISGSQAQVTSDIYLNGSGAATADGTLALEHVQFATLDHGTGDSPAERGWEIEFDGFPTTFSGVGIVFRYQDATHYWHAFWYNAASTGPRVYLERQNGSDFASASPRVDVLADNVEALDNVLRVIAIGSSIEVYTNDVLRHSVTDSSFEDATHHGISFYFTGHGIDRFNYPTGTPWTVGRVAWGDRGAWH